MDLNRYARVFWRFRLIMGIGLALATLVAVFSLGTPTLAGGKPSIKYRESDVWLSASTLLVTQEGFPWGRAILDDVIEVENPGSDPLVIPRFGDPGRYSGLAALYAELAKADEVQAVVAKGNKPGQYYEPMIVQQPGATATLPMIYLKGYGPSPEDAVDVANRASKAFIAYLEQVQDENEIGTNKRVEVEVTSKATPPQLFEKRSFVRPMFLFLLITTGFIALVFALENLRPSRRPESELESEFDDSEWIAAETLDSVR
jgi:hypothetical protein